MTEPWDTMRARTSGSVRPIQLHVVPSQGEPYDRVFDREQCIMGRTSDSDLRLADRFLSRHHARLFRDGDDVLAEDMGSRNGTLLNGRPLDGATKVREGDVLTLGGTTVTLGDGGPPAPVRASVLSDRTVFRDASVLAEPISRDHLESRNEEELRRYADRLAIVNDVHQALSRSIEVDELLELILERAFDHLQPEQGVVFLREVDEEGDAEMRCAASRGVPGAPDEQLFSRTLQREVVDKGQAALVLDVEADERFHAAQSILVSGVRSLVAAPLLHPDGSLGMIALVSRVQKRHFDEKDMELLATLASIAAMRLRNIALTEAAKERHRLEKELALARRIQTALLPEKLPEIPGCELYARNVPSRGVSGDYYVAVERDHGEHAVMIADVSGKGIAASLLTASLEALAAGPIEGGESPESICRDVSRRLYRRTPPEKYATALLAVLRPDGELRWANAGHNPGFLIRADGDVVELAPTGPPIALIPGADWTLGVDRLDPGDLLALYTDGITEAMDPEDEEYGEERLAAVLRERRAAPLAEISAAVSADLLRFACGVPYADDRTLVLLRRLPADG